MNPGSVASRPTPDHLARPTVMAVNEERANYRLEMPPSSTSPIPQCLNATQTPRPSSNSSQLLKEASRKETSKQPANFPESRNQVIFNNLAPRGSRRSQKGFLAFFMPQTPVGSLLECGLLLRIMFLSVQNTIHKVIKEPNYTQISKDLLKKKKNPKKT